MEEERIKKDIDKPTAFLELPNQNFSKKLSEEEILNQKTSFEELGITDPRLQRATEKLNWIRPTLIQAASIPLAMAGRDILAKARTGSGKTGAYALPCIQKLLVAKHHGSLEPGIKILVLVPTRELCEQTTKNFEELMHYCRKEITILQLSTDVSITEQIPRLQEDPDILIATPGRLNDHLKAGNTFISRSLMMLVLDEADLMLSYGYEKNLHSLFQQLPPACHCFLMSATLNDDVERLKKLALHSPAVLQLYEPKAVSKLAQYYITTSVDDKFLILYTMLKLGLIKLPVRTGNVPVPNGKVLLFVNSVDNCFRLKIFLERFSINTALLNPEMPYNTKSNTIEQFNKGFISILIATDSELLEFNEEGKDFDILDKKVLKSERVSKYNRELKDAQKGRKRELKKIMEDTESEFGVARGIDFKGVSTVINFDMPITVSSYVHRIGRTSRTGGLIKGTAISFIESNQTKLLKKIQNFQNRQGTELKEYKFKTDIIEGFRYRVYDVYKAITPTVIKYSRLTEIKNQIIKSKELRNYFSKNPKELQLIKHDSHIQKTRIQEHLEILPNYLNNSLAQDEEALGDFGEEDSIPKKLEKKLEAVEEREKKKLLKQAKKRHTKTLKRKIARKRKNGIIDDKTNEKGNLDSKYDKKGESSKYDKKGKFSKHDKKGGFSKYDKKNRSSGKKSNLSKKSFKVGKKKY
eukprot:TRINITY_DN5528_c0_g1_i1.p1 TRINITY_DN5528_c0_g1~~TRINITY_DN5528_c0_g1_i1.p1  ORF type:complete len:741 (-),score=312.16 TRINITY_DN5528_c0_g1_i1:150-2234(-)